MHSQTLNKMAASQRRSVPGKRMYIQRILTMNQSRDFVETVMAFVSPQISYGMN